MGDLNILSKMEPDEIKNLKSIINSKILDSGLKGIFDFYSSKKVMEYTFKNEHISMAKVSTDEDFSNERFDFILSVLEKIGNDQELRLKIVALNEKCQAFEEKICQLELGSAPIPTSQKVMGSTAKAYKASTNSNFLETKNKALTLKNNFAENSDEISRRISALITSRGISGQSGLSGVSRVEAEVQSLIDYMDNLMSMNNQLTGKVSELKQRNEKLMTGEREDYSKRVAILTQKAQGLEEELEHKNRYIKGKESSFKTISSKMQGHIEELQNQNKELNSKLLVELEKVKYEGERTLSKLGLCLEEKKVELESLRRKYQDLKSNYEDLHKNYASMEMESEKAKEERAKSIEFSSFNENYVTKLKQKLEKQSESIAVLSGKLFKSAAKSEELELVISEKEAELKRSLVDNEKREFLLKRLKELVPAFAVLSESLREEVDCLRDFFSFFVKLCKNYSVAFSYFDVESVWSETERLRESLNDKLRGLKDLINSGDSPSSSVQKPYSRIDKKIFEMKFNEVFSPVATKQGVQNLPQQSEGQDEERLLFVISQLERQIYQQRLREEEISGIKRGVEFEISKLQNERKSILENEANSNSLIESLIQSKDIMVKEICQLKLQLKMQGSKCGTLANEETDPESTALTLEVYKNLLERRDFLLNILLNNPQLSRYFVNLVSSLFDCEEEYIKLVNSSRHEPSLSGML